MTADASTAPRTNDITNRWSILLRPRVRKARVARSTKTPTDGRRVPVQVRAVAEDASHIIGPAGTSAARGARQPAAVQRQADEHPADSMIHVRYRWRRAHTCGVGEAFITCRYRSDDAFSQHVQHAANSSRTSGHSVRRATGVGAVLRLCVTLSQPRRRLRGTRRGW